MPQCASYSLLLPSHSRLSACFGQGHCAELRLSGAKSTHHNQKVPPKTKQICIIHGSPRISPAFVTVAPLNPKRNCIQASVTTDESRSATPGRGLQIFSSKNFSVGRSTNYLISCAFFSSIDSSLPSLAALHANPRCFARSRICLAGKFIPLYDPPWRSLSAICASSGPRVPAQLSPATNPLFSIHTFVRLLRKDLSAAFACARQDDTCKAMLRLL